MVSPSPRAHNLVGPKERNHAVSQHAGAPKAPKDDEDFVSTTAFIRQVSRR
jgi:hypothetical protein